MFSRSLHDSHASVHFGRSSRLAEYTLAPPPHSWVSTPTTPNKICCILKHMRQGVPTTSTAATCKALTLQVPPRTTSHLTLHPSFQVFKLSVTLDHSTVEILDHSNDILDGVQPLTHSTHSLPRPARCAATRWGSTVPPWYQSGLA